MLKKVTILLALTLLLTCIGGSACQAEILPAHGEGQIGYQAVVLCESLTVRQGRSSGSRAVKTLYFGDTFIVQECWDGWADCFLSDDCDEGPAGWVNADYILVNPTWYRTDEATPVFAWNDTMASRVALLSKGTVLPIVKDDGDWLIVSLRGAVGWIYKNEADRLAAGTEKMIRSISGLETAELVTPRGTFTLMEEQGLKWIEENFSIAQPCGATACPFDATLTLFLADRREITLYMATDGCSVFRTEDGSYFAYGDRNEALRLYDSTSVIGETFWGLFGITASYEGIY
ncbi:MAG: hypothetical protein CW338_00700 [Clostridiales bacterium]|nr:hypothetical protein [Clostridiales bacterium]